MIKKFISYFTLLSYLIISLLSTGQDVLCIHNSGFSSFETMINSECVSMELNKHKKNDKLGFSTLDIDHCSDLPILNDLRSPNSKIFSISLISTNIIVSEYVKYLIHIDLESDNKIYLSQISKKDIIDKSHANYISTFVLTI